MGDGIGRVDRNAGFELLEVVGDCGFLYLPASSHYNGKRQRTFNHSQIPECRSTCWAEFERRGHGKRRMVGSLTLQFSAPFEISCLV